MTPDDMEWTELIDDAALASKLAARIAKANGLDLPADRIDKGSNLLFGIGDRLVLKVFSPEEQAFRDNEALFLKKLQGMLSVKLPGLHRKGEIDSFPYLIMDRLEGRSLEDVWDSLDRDSKTSIARDIGILLKELHSLPVELVEGCVPEWSTFIETQKQHLSDNHSDYGLAPSRVNEVVEFVDDWDPVEDYVQPVICHTEIMPEHLFVTEDENGIRLSGLIDFEPSMLAVPQYDLCAVGLFVTAGDPELFEAFLEAYDSMEDTSEPTITRMLLLHRYSNMNWFISTLPVDLRTMDILSLGRHWYATTNTLKETTT